MRSGAIGSNPASVTSIGAAVPSGDAGHVIAEAACAGFAGSAATAITPTAAIEAAKATSVARCRRPGLDDEVCMVAKPVTGLSQRSVVVSVGP